MNPHSSTFQRGAAIINAGLTVALIVLWLSMALKGVFWRGDFPAFYSGWTIILAGDGDRLYDLEEQQQQQAALLPEFADENRLLPFVNPPHAALAMAPLALLPRDAAFYAWTALQVLLCVLGARFILRLLPDLRPDARFLALLTVAAFPPGFMSFQLGQVTLLCVVCVLGFAVALREDRPVVMAVWILLGTVKPQLMVVPVVALLALGRWRALAWLATFGLAALALTTLVLGPTCWTDYLAILRFSTQQFGTFGIDPAGMYNLKGVLTNVLGAGRGDLVNLLTKVAWLAGLFVIAALLWRSTPEERDLRLALALLIGALINPHVNPTDVLAFVPPAVLFVAYLHRRNEAASFATLAVCGPSLFVADYYFLAPLGPPIRFFFLLGVLVCCWMASYLFRVRPDGRRTEPMCAVAPQ